MNIIKAHRQYGHGSEAASHGAAMALNTQLTGAWETCDACTVAKAKQKNDFKNKSNL